MTRQEAFHIRNTYDILRGVILSLTSSYVPSRCQCCRKPGKHTDFNSCSSRAGLLCCSDCFRTMADEMTINTHCGNGVTMDDTPQWGLQYAVDYKQGHPEEYQMHPDGALATI